MSNTILLLTGWVILKQSARQPKQKINCGQKLKIAEAIKNKSNDKIISLQLDYTKSSNCEISNSKQLSLHKH